jgi:uncharacterized damage-inducible protein DinB
MEKDEVYDDIADSRQALMAAVSGLDSDTLSKVKIDENWTIKDLLIHIIAWDEVCLIPLKALSTTGVFEAEAIPDRSAWNAAQVARRSELPMDSIWRELTRVRLELLGVAQRLDDTQWKMEFSLPWGERGTVAQILSGLAWHENEHTQQIEKWVQERK